MTPTDDGFSFPRRPVPSRPVAAAMPERRVPRAEEPAQEIETDEQTCDLIT